MGKKKWMAAFLAAAMAFGALSGTGIPVNAEDNGAPLTITVEFGENHGDIAAKFAENIDGAWVEGTQLKYIVSSDNGGNTTVSNVKEMCLNDANEDYSFGLVDDGELFLQKLATKPASDFSSTTDYNLDVKDDYTKVLTEGITLYAQWAKPVGQVTLEITPPAPGTTVSVTGDNATKTTDPQPEVNVTNDAKVTVSSVKNWATSDYSSYYTGTVADGQSMYARVFLNAEYGYYFGYDDKEGNYHSAPNTSVTVSNGNGTKVRLDGTPDTVEVWSTVWAGNDDEPEVYDIDIDDSIKYGKVTVAPTTAHEGETITVNAVPDDLCEFKSLSYTTSDGQTFELEKEAGGNGYFFTMPASSVVIHAEFERLYEIHVDFGEGHEDFVQTNFSGIDGYEIDGSVVTFVYSDSTKNAYDAKNYFISNLPDIAYADLFDDGEKFMRDVGLNPISYYSNQIVLQLEDRDLSSMDITHGVTFYALWAQPITDAVITIEPPVCGTVITAASRGATWQADPAPVLSASGGIIFQDADIFFNNWSIDGLVSVGDTVTIEGGETYTARCYLSPAWGYYLQDGFTDFITVEGGELAATNVNGSKDGILISVVAVHAEGDDAVIVPPTCEKDGTKTFACTYCGEEVEEVLEATGHDWGDWVVVTPATVDSTGLKQRTCKNDPSHTETRVIPKLTPAPESETEPASPASDPYSVKDAGSGEYIVGSNTVYTITIKRLEDDANCYAYFTGVVMIDGKALVRGTDFTDEAGSTIIHLQPSALDQLEPGEHIITVVFDDGEVTVTITVRAAQASDTASAEPAKTTAAAVQATGEGENFLAVVGGIVCLSAAGVILMAVLERKRRYGKK